MLSAMVYNELTKIQPGGHLYMQVGKLYVILVSVVLLNNKHCVRLIRTQYLCAVLRALNETHVSLSSHIFEQ